jgi:ABC-2 type transport system permease protein
MISVELSKLLLRPRVWLTVLLLCGLPALVAAFLAFSRLAPPPGRGGAFLSAVMNNGLLYPAAALALILPVFLPVAVAVVAGDAIAGESAAGTLRYLRVRPVSRTRLLGAKLVALAAFCALALTCVVLSALAVGVAFFGAGSTALGGLGGGVTALSGVTLTPPELTIRLIAAVGYIAVCMIGFGSIALFLSTLTDTALGAALGALAVLVTSSVLETLDAAALVRPYLPTHYWLSWIDFFREPIFWLNIQKGLLLQAAYVVVCLGAAWANFATKDITS